MVGSIGCQYPVISGGDPALETVVVVVLPGTRHHTWSRSALCLPSVGSPGPGGRPEEVTFR